MPCSLICISDDEMLTSVCEGVWYDHKTHKCCDNKLNHLLGMTSTTRPHYHCCGTVAYNSLVYQCCEGQLVVKVVHGPHSKCCDTVTYNSQTQMCCDLVIVTRPDGSPRCCGKVPYDSDNYRCEDGKIVCS